MIRGDFQRRRNELLEKMVDSVAQLFAMNNLEFDIGEFRRVAEDRLFDVAGDAFFYGASVFPDSNLPIDSELR